MTGMIITGMAAMDTPTITDDKLLRLFAWMSPAFPTGGFAYSHGLEWAVEKGFVRDLDSLVDWMRDVIAFGSGWTDCVLLRQAWRCEDAVALDAVAELAAALAPSRERFEETIAQGGAFARAIAVWGVLPAAIGIDDARAMALPVVIGASLRVGGIDEDRACLAALQGFVANLVSAAVRLIPLGQTDGLRAIAALEEPILSTTARSSGATLDDVGGFSFNADLASLHHETQETRLFRT